MKINEELYLKKSINIINKYAKEKKLAADFYDSLDELNINSLQELSFKNDLEFFDKINFILSVIISIVVKPHISNTGEEIILRSDQVGSIQNDMFMQTLKDASLWKHNLDKEMIPEYVHYYQNIDLLRIYENIFIVMLINMLDSELNNYNEFYSNMIMTFTGEDTLSLSDSAVYNAFDKISKLLRKIRRIKETYFYKAISRAGSCKLSHVRPTNILLKDRLYNFCFKFYRTLITYEDKDALVKDFSIYYYVLFLKKLKSLGFRLVSNEELLSKSSLDLKDNVVTLYKSNMLNLKSKLVLENDSFKVNLSYDNDIKAIKFDVTNLLFNNYQAKHALLIEPDDKFETIKERLKNYNDDVNIQAISLWNMAYVDDKNVSIIRQNPKTEEELIESFISEKIKCVKGSKKLYKNYCPVCKTRTTLLDEVSEVYVCDKCLTSYGFVESQEDTMWFIKLRR